MFHDIPPEVLNLIFKQLEHNRNFSTLYAAALSCKRLADVALPWLYRHSDSVAFGREDHVHEGFGTPWELNSYFLSPESHQEYHKYRSLRYVARQTRLWKSILLSSRDQTAYPYCLYIRSLNFNLNALESYDFFREPEMIKFVTLKELPTDLTDPLGRNDIDIPRSSEFIAFSIMSHISESAQWSGIIVKLEYLAWYNDAATLTKWISQMPKLQSLAISTSFTTDLKDLAKGIAENCPRFQNLRVIVNPDTQKEQEDKMLSQFLQELKPNTLRKFINSVDQSTIRHICRIGPETLLSLNHHSETLKTLKLCCQITDDLLLISSCKGLTSIQTTRSEISMPDKLVDWVCSHHGLRELSVGSLSNGTETLTKVCSKDWIQLQKLEILDINFQQSEEFFRALSTQNSLEYLRIGGSLRNCRKEAQKNICSISCLTNLRFLHLSAYEKDNDCLGDFEEYAIIAMVKNLSKLEEITFSCLFATDEIWATMKELHHLRVLNIDGISAFTYEEVLGYINVLHSTNRGLQLSIVNYEHGNLFRSQQKSSLQRAIHEKVGGHFHMWQGLGYIL
ncbi:hypothetical protein K3495_g6183 [Podosphaera aphanis]|nr:hypothetical protein K3495_g6183 [Podosphaera aphanis]